MNPDALVGTAVDQVTITFDELINLGTFTPSAITLTGPGGTVAVNQPTLVSGTTYAIGFGSALAPGSYALVIAASVADLAGNEMDQTQNGVNGQAGNGFSGTFSIALPDLIVAPGSIVPPPSAVTGTTVPITFQITNQGTEPTYSVWQDVVILSQNPNLVSQYDGIDDGVLFNNNVVEAFPNVSLLNPGQSYTQNVSVALPISAQVDATDTWYVYVVPDGTGSHFEPHMAEASRTDKIARSAAFTVTLSPLPSLAVTTVIAPADSFSGQSITVGWTVANNGTVATSVDSWADAVYMSTSNSSLTGATLLGTFAHIGVLTAGGSYTNSQEVTLPLTMPGSPTVLLSGSYYFLVEADIAGLVYENPLTKNNLGATNNAKTVLPAGTPALTVSTVTPPPPALAGHDVSFSYTVVNDGLGGTEQSVWADSYYLSPTSTFSAGTSLLGQQQITGGLDAGADYTQTINVTLPLSISGVFYILVDTDSGDVNLEATADQSKKWGASAPFQVSNAPPELEVSSLSAPSAAVAGSAVLVNWTVANQGTGATAVGSWQDDLYADKNATLDASAVLLGTYTHNGVLTAGSSYTASELVTVPISFLGDFNLFVIANANGAVAETNTSNGTSAPAPITVSLQLPSTSQNGTVQQAEVAGLQVVSVTSSASAAPGANPTVSWTVVNDGPGTTDSNYWDDDIWISTNTTLGSGGTDIYLDTVQHTNPLADGASYSASATVTVPLTVPAGTYYFIVTTDRPVPPPADPNDPTANQGGNLVYGGNPANEQLAASAPTQVLNPPPADLAVSDIIVPATATSGQTLSVGWTVSNSGGSTGNVSITDAVWLSLDQVFDASADRCLGTATFSGTLATSGSYTQQPTSFQLPAGLAGNYYVFVQTNSNGSVYELNTANGTAYAPQPVQINVPPLAELSAGTVTIPATALAGKTMDVTYTVTDLAGSSAANGSWTDAVYLSTSQTGTDNDVLLGQIPNPMSLAPGASYTVSNWPVQIPGMAPGAYYVLVRTNVLDNLPESTTANNLGASATTVAIDAQPLATPTNGTPTSVTGNLTTGQSDYYKVVMTAGQTLRLNFTTSTVNSLDELYVSQGTMPTRGQYDYRFPSAGPNQQITVPLTQAGAYYILAYGGAGQPSGGESYTLTASLVPFSIQTVAPATVGAGQATVEIDGAQFNSNTIFQLLVPGGTPITAQAVQLQDSTVAFATFNLTGVAPGSYDLQAANGSTTTTLTLGLTVAAMAPPTLQTYLTVPDGVLPGPSGALPGHEGTVTVNYVNQGNTDAVAPLFQLSATHAELELADYTSFTANPVWFLGTSSTGPAGILRPGESGQVTITFLATGADRQIIDFNLQTAADSQTIDWSSQEGALQPATIPDAAWPAVFANFVANVGTTVGSFHAALAADATDLSQLGQPAYDMLTLMSLEIAKADAAYPVQTPIATITDDTLGGLTFQRSFQQSIAGRYTSGMLGFGWTTNWDISASADANGNVTVLNNGAVLYYALQTNGTYVPANGEGEGSVLTFANNAYQLVEANGTIIQFNPNGTLAFVQDANGYTVTASYAMDGRLATLTDSNGDQFTLSYNSQGLLSQLTDSSGATVIYGYDPTGQFLTTVTNSGTTSYSYVTGLTVARDNALASIASSSSATVTFTYNADGVLTAASNGGPGTLSGLPGMGGPPVLPVIPLVLSATNTTPIIEPTDPNCIVNPTGTGPAAFYVPAAAPLNYTIDFLNTGGAPAQVVEITEQLDSNLDWSTFQTGTMTLDGVQYDVLIDGAEHYTLANGTTLDVISDLDLENGLATWVFAADEPNDEPSSDITIGALRSGRWRLC